MMMVAMTGFAMQQAEAANIRGKIVDATDKSPLSEASIRLVKASKDSTYVAGSTDKVSISKAQAQDDYDNTGVANRLTNVMTNRMSVIASYAGTSAATDDQSYLGKLITEMQTKMNNFKTLMQSYENSLYKKYDAMEVALSKLGAQLGYITGGN